MVAVQNLARHLGDDVSAHPFWTRVARCAASPP
jgi:hypothetical protein